MFYGKGFIMNFEKHTDPFRALRIGNGRAIELIGIDPTGYRRGMLSSLATKSFLKAGEETNAWPIHSMEYILIYMENGEKYFEKWYGMQEKLVIFEGVIYKLPLNVGDSII